MKFATRISVFVAISIGSMPASAEGLRETVLRAAALKAGLLESEATRVPVPANLAAIGKRLFESKKLSLNEETACASCHIDQFGSADGLPNAVGTGGRGIGLIRAGSGGDIIPRNTLPFWGRGGKGFDVFFWDGKVDGSSGSILSQFAGQEPSDDALVVAVHLPPVEIGEMITDSSENSALQKETVAAANDVYELLIERVREDASLGSPLSIATGVPVEELKFLNVAEAIAAFVRDNFRVRSTRFHDFVFNRMALSNSEVAGGLIFYGKGKCAICHNGPYFSDFKFHAIPFPQVGFGKNGFGIDYGRFNVTMNYADQYKFRTPPLFNVSKTAPYSHSGSVNTLQEAILAHTDPLVLFGGQEMSGPERTSFYERLKFWSSDSVPPVFLGESEIEDLIDFLKTLEFDAGESVRIVD